MLRKLGLLSDNSLDVNDLHSLLNATHVSAIARPKSLAELVEIIKDGAMVGKPLSISGSRHAMGGQQFLSDEQLLDTRALNKVIELDTVSGFVTVEAGVEWPDLVAQLQKLQKGVEPYWTIATKQTGADKLTLGGAVSANAHGRGLTRSPMAADILALQLVNAEGTLITCSREQNEELFSLVLGGYGLFGVIYSVSMRLERRHKLERIVALTSSDDLMGAFDKRVQEGFSLGDWQFTIDETQSNFLKWGVFSCYRTVPLDTPIPSGQKKVSKRAWNELVYLAHAEKSKAFQLYADYYMSSSGQVYWSDTSQLGGYDEGYHATLDRRLKSACPGSEMITEIYVPRDKFAEFMDKAASTIKQNGASVIYGTVRLIEPDEDSFLRWAKDRYACIIFNLHVDHTPEKLMKAAEEFKALIDISISLSGSFYLTYHRWAKRQQLEACYPNVLEFLAAKKKYDPKLRFQSNWYRHLASLFPEA